LSTPFTAAAITKDCSGPRNHEKAEARCPCYQEKENNFKFPEENSGKLKQDAPCHQEKENNFKFPEENSGNLPGSFPKGSRCSCFR